MYNICFVIKHSRNLIKGDECSLLSCKFCGDKPIPDVAKYAKIYNLTRRVACLLCAEGSGDENDMYERWEGHTGPDKTIIYTSLDRPSIVKPIIHSVPVMTQIEQQLPPEEIKGWPSAMKQLEYELKREGEKVSIPHYMATHGYRMSAAIRLGLTFEMVIEDWNSIFVTKLFSASDLMEIGARFTRMVIAGLPLELFSTTGMDAPALNIIRFNYHAFCAAGGTKEQWDRIISGAGDNPFGYTWGYGTKFECCKK